MNQAIICYYVHFLNLIFIQRNNLCDLNMIPNYGKTQLGKVLEIIEIIIFGPLSDQRNMKMYDFQNIFVALKCIEFTNLWVCCVLNRLNNNIHDSNWL